MRCFTLIISASFLGIAAPALAQSEGEERWQEMSDVELGQIGTDFFNNSIQAPCARGLPALQELSRRYPDNVSYSSSAPLGMALCAFKEERWVDAQTHYREFESQGLSYNPFLGLDIATRAEDADDVLARLKTLILETELPIDDPYGRQVTSSAMRLVYRENGLADLAEIGTKAMQEGRFETLSEGLAAGFASYALRAPEQLSPADIARLLDHIPSPPSYLNMLASRDFEAVWPEVAQRAGPNLRRITSEYVAKNRAQLAADPDNTEEMNELSYALFYDGQFAEIIELAKDWSSRPDSPDKIDEHTAWVMNMAAYSYDALGNPQAADAIFDEMAEIDERQNGWVVNFVINRATRLVSAGRFEEGLAATERSGPVADEYGSTYAQMIVARDRACALQMLGRPEEAQEELPFIRENSDASLMLAGTALLCLGLDDEMIAIFAEAFEDESEVKSYLVDLQEERFDLYYTPSLLRSPADLVWQDPGLSARLLEVGRRIPEEFVPAASLVRFGAE